MQLPAITIAEPTTHVLKCWKAHYEPMDKGDKTCEVRLNDRNYQRGDYLILKEWDPDTQSYTGRESEPKVITHILSGWGVAPGHVALSLRSASIVKGNGNAI